MKMDNVRVYGFDESIIASGYPMQTEIQPVSESMESELKRAKHLGAAENGSGHDCFLKGIVVQADVTAPQYWWLEFGRYHFADIVSSQSKMHRITKMDIDSQLGLMLTARITTNYLQLKSMHLQRKNHKLKEWHTFCNWIEKLPMFTDIVLK